MDLFNVLERYAHIDEQRDLIKWQKLNVSLPPSANAHTQKLRHRHKRTNEHIIFIQIDAHSSEEKIKFIAKLEVNGKSRDR